MADTCSLHSASIASKSHLQRLLQLKPRRRRRMRRPLLVWLLTLFAVVSFTSAGIMQHVPRIPNLFTYFFQGLREANKTETKQPASPVPPFLLGLQEGSQSEIESTTLPPILPSVLNSYYNMEGETISSSITLPSSGNGGQRRVDLCEGDIVVPLSNDRNTLIEQTYKSTKFPYERSNPLVCTWNVKVTDNCRRGVVTMRINKRSRLADVDGCTKGYYRVSPFMKETKICGRIETLPPFQWYVEDQQPDDVSIVLKHAGLNDGYWEGLSFTLSGECLPNDSNMTSSQALKTYNSWMQKILKESETVDLTVA
ncbi:uncharacterized protein LOC116923733 [Daphnia magna]|uniref:uncharacterized protein LOC116923733 n=1 Tax=Daphnia magna TaxID=35525 RepID=UPI001E1BAAB3|nr:uncharacterized protein LOC116923733 [Daphnia magna]